jgi:hypothetical protein
MLRIEFGCSAPSPGELCSLPYPLALARDRRNRLDLVNEFPRRIDEYLSKRVADPDRRRKVHAALNRATRNMFLSYVIERKIGLGASSDQMTDLLAARTDTTPMLDVAALMSGLPEGQSSTSAGRFLHTAVLCLQVIDELQDVQQDYNRQPNLVLSLAREAYPVEGRRIERAAQRDRLRGWSGQIALWTMAPRTVLRVIALFSKRMREMGRIHPLGSGVCFFVYIMYALLRSDRSRRASIHARTGGLVDA